MGKPQHQLQLTAANMRQLDKFDNESHFQNQVPALAASNPHLKYSILALSARQTERKDLNQPSSGSLALYQAAIHLLLPNLGSKDSAVIASCVLLCVIEMMSCKLLSQPLSIMQTLSNLRQPKGVEASPRRMCRLIRCCQHQRLQWWAKPGSFLVLRKNGYVRILFGHVE